MNFLKNVSVLIVGLGESGVACAQFAHRYGALVHVVDTREQPPGLVAIQALQGVTIQLGDKVLSTCAIDRLPSINMIAMSPGLAPTAPDVAALIAAAKAQGVQICSELDWFMLALDDLKTNTVYASAVLAITGTNGKTTVTELTTHLANEAGIAATACGNISPAMLTALMDALDQQLNQGVALPRIWVLELSSFQLHYTQTFNPTAATVLNLTQDHLDWHSDMQEYARCKSKVFGMDTVQILNRDDATVLAMRKTSSKVSKTSDSYTFGLSSPTAVGDLGCTVDGSLNWLSQAVEVEPEKKRRKADVIQAYAQKLMPADALRIRGSHNHANAMAALLLVQAAGVGISKALHGLRTYVGAPNRCELVSVIDDVEYINDSKGTNVGATVAALQGLGEARNRLVLIAGGVGKGQDFSPLLTVVSQTCKAVITIGQAAFDISTALRDSGVTIHTARDLTHALEQASGIATTGDAVLLSPACASFDMFKSYAHRAQVFVEAVQQLALDRGQA